MRKRAGGTRVGDPGLERCGVSNTFTAGSIVAFLVFGPMVDIKMLAMMRTTYKARLLAVITLVVALSSILIGLAVNYVL